MTKRHRSISDYTPTIYKGADGYWHGRIVVGFNPDGSYIRPHRKAVKRSDVVRKIKALEARRDAGHAWESDSVTLEAWLHHWLTDVVKVKLSPKTYATYRSSMYKHVIPELGGVALEHLTTEQIERLYAKLLREGRSDYTVTSAHRTLRSGLGEAVLRRKLPINPATRAAISEVEEVEIEPLHIEEMTRVGAAAKLRVNTARWSIALALGLRQGEALGLRWENVNLDKGILRVRNGLQRINWEHGCGSEVWDEPRCGKKRGGSCPERHGGGLLLVRLKTKASRRKISIPDYLLEELKAHRRAQVAQRLRTPGWNELDLVFCKPDGRPIDPKHDGKEWHDLLQVAGVRRARLHDARHSAASLLLDLGVDQRILMKIMGWTDPRTARRYTHVVDQQRRDVASKVNGALGGSA